MIWEPGDLLIFFGREPISRLIELATRGPSHIGILSAIPTSRHDALLVESTTLCDLPDAVTGRRTSGVQSHVPEERIATYRGRVARLRLSPWWRLTSDEAFRLADFLFAHLGRPYDAEGAAMSGTRILKWTSLLPYADLGSLFCSELCAAALMRFGRLPLENPSVYNPASLVRRLRRCGIYGAPETIRVSPGSEQ